MADQAQRLKTIADNLESTYQSLRRAASNIAGLLKVGRATCDEVKAYNLWAIAVYNTQRGMLATLRANGEPNVPELPTAPTMFGWKGVRGQDAWQINCAGQASSLSGVMKTVLRGPSETTQYLSSNEIDVVTDDSFAFAPENSPSFATLAALTQQREQQGMAGLGVVGVLIAIAGIAIAVTVTVAAIMHYLEVSEVQEANTAQTKMQADAFAAYTAARLACYSSCTQQGKSTEECVELCKKLVDKPNIKIPGMDTRWGALQWIGFTVIAGVTSVAALKIWQRKREGKPMFELPESVEHAINPPGQ